jgi:hypothetical protein
MMSGAAPFSSPLPQADGEAKRLKPLSYAFARERGIALKDGRTPVFLLREDADGLALLEARRAAGAAFEVTRLGCAGV